MTNEYITHPEEMTKSPKTMKLPTPKNYQPITNLPKELWKQRSSADKQSYGRKPRSKRKYLKTAWAGYREVFNSAPHSRIIECLEI